MATNNAKRSRRKPIIFGSGAVALLAGSLGWYLSDAWNNLKNEGRFGTSQNEASHEIAGEITSEPAPNFQSGEFDSFDVYRKAISEMEMQGLHTARFDLSNEGMIHSVTEAFAGSSLEDLLKENVVVASSESSFLEIFYDSMGADQKQFVKDHVNYVVFSPGVVSRLGTSTGDVNGLSIGEGIIFIDTEADDGYLKTVSSYPSVIGHEADHESNNKKNLSTLASELSATQRVISILEWQLRNERSEFLKGLLRHNESVVETAEHLQSYGNDFAEVYPHPVLLAKYVLQAAVTREAVAKHKQHKNGMDDKAYEVYIANFFADIVLSKEKGDAIRLLYQYVKNPEYADTLVLVNAASALQFLVPELCVVKSSSNMYRNGGVHFEFGDSDPGKHRSKDDSDSITYGVVGLPSLSKLLGHKENSYVSGGEEASDGALISTGDGLKVQYISNRELKLLIGDTGIPSYADKEGTKGDGWKFHGAFAADFDDDGIFDGVELVYVLPAHELPGGLYVGKVDRYNSDGIFMSASFQLGEDTEELDENPKDALHKLIKKLEFE